MRDIILHIETSTDICSVALSNGVDLLSINEVKNSLKHSEIITEQIKSVFADAGIDTQKLSAVSLSEGPGSYTSLRVGLSAAKAMCFAYDIPLISVNTLTSLAFSSEYVNNAFICSMIDARRSEVYASLFDVEGKPVFENEAIILDEKSFERYFSKGIKIVFNGNGAQKTQSFIRSESAIFEDKICSSKNLINIAFQKFKKQQFGNLYYFSPNYIKPPNITTPKKKIL